MSGRTRSGAGWELHVQVDGEIDVKLNGRLVQHDCEDVDDAVQVVRSHRDYSRGDRIALVELDGHRTVLVGSR